MRWITALIVTFALACAVSACTEQKVGQNQSPVVTVTLVNENGHGGDKVDLATCTGAVGQGTGLLINNLTFDPVCVGGNGGTATVTLDLQSTAAANFVDAFLTANDPADGHPQVLANLIPPVLGSHGNSETGQNGWTFVPPDKYIYQWTFSGTVSNYFQICFAQTGANGNPEKCVCTAVMNVCPPQPPVENACLHRTRGFWGTHPAITGTYLPLTVCGVALTQTDAGSCHSTSEALCTSLGTEWKSIGPSAGQLVAQLTTAKLNVAASIAAGGSCGDIAQLIDKCEGFCFKSQEEIGASGCIADLDAFNNAASTILPPPFDNPGPAKPKQCQLANGNGTIVGPTCQ